MAEPFGAEGLALEAAREQVLAAVRRLAAAGTAAPGPTAVTTVPLAAALGRVCAQSVHAPAAVPGFRASIMDGYGIAGGDQPPTLGERWQLVGRSGAGAPFNGSLAAGEAVRILTGAAVPAGCERVLPQELVERLSTTTGEAIELVKPCGANAWIRSPEEEAAPGQELLAAGQRLGVATLARLASCGVATLAVQPQPRIGLLISGDELLPPGSERGPGQIWESNSALLTALLARLGHGVHTVRVVVDQPEPLRQALLELAESCTVVVSTGGVSAGDSDWIRPLVAELGAVEFWKLFLKPGRPFAFGELRGRPFFGLPGNPVAAAITALQLLWPALQVLEGAEPEPLPRLKVRLETELRRGAGRPELARAQLVVGSDGGLLARVSGSQASSRIGSLQGADLLLEIPAELGALPAGTELWAQLLRLPLF